MKNGKEVDESLFELLWTLIPFTKKRLKNVLLGFWNIIPDTIIFSFIPEIMSYKN